MTRYVAYGLLCCLLILSACDDPTPQLDPPPFKTSWTKTELDQVNVYAIAGDYHEAQIGVSGDQLTGVYRDPTLSKNKACWFFFEGKLTSQNPIIVNCYNPTDNKPAIKGEFKILGEVVFMKLLKNPATNCNHELTDDVGRTVVLDLQHQWSAVRVTQHEANIFEVPDAKTTPLEKLLPKGTAVAVCERRKNWLLVEVLSNLGQKVWIQEHQLYPLLF